MYFITWNDMDLCPWMLWFENETDYEKAYDVINEKFGVELSGNVKEYIPFTSFKEFDEYWRREVMDEG